MWFVVKVDQIIASCARTVGSDTSKTQYVKNSLSQMIESTCQSLYKEEQIDCLESVQHGCQNQWHKLFFAQSNVSCLSFEDKTD